MADVTLPVSRQGRAVLNHPDQESRWTIVVVARLQPGVVPRALADVVATVPLAGARLIGGRWRVGQPVPVANYGDPLNVDLVARRFDLAEEPPLRAGQSPGALTLVGHHAAFDGLALARILGLLLGAEGTVRAAPASDPAPSGRSAGHASRRASPRAGLLPRLLRPADRVAPSHPLPDSESFASRSIRVPPGRFTPRMAAATAATLLARHRGGRTWRAGISVAVAGSPGFENTASYRRVDLDLRPGSDAAGPVAAAVATALADRVEPRELSVAPRLFRGLSFLVRRASDTFLVSNLGALELPGVMQLDFYPVARGRSAVAIGAAGVVGGSSSVTLRARDLSQADADALLDEIVGRLA